jgi:large subunit ribosomal protein L33
MPRELITLQCTECKRRNYTSAKEKRNTPNRIEKKKFCKFDRKHTLHREVK